MSTVERFSVVEQPDVAIGGEPLVVIPPGLYDLKYKYHETKLYGSGKAPKVVIRFEIVGPDHRGTTLPCYYAVESLCGKPSKYGRFRLAGFKSRFLRDYATVFVEPGRLDRATPRHYKGRIIQGEVVTVKKGWDGHDIPRSLQYSKIESLIWLVD